MRTHKFPAIGIVLALITTSACSTAHQTESAVLAPGGTLPDGPRELTADQQIKQALNRLAFGGRPGDYERVRAMGVDRWIDQQLHPERIRDDETERFLAQFPTLGMTTAEVVREYPQPQLVLAQKQRELARSDSAGNKKTDVLPSREDSLAFRMAAQKAQRVTSELVTAKVARAVMSERQLQEGMVDFWENHFSVFNGKGPTRYMLPEYDRDVIRPHALGKFRDLLEAVARSPAMLYYLDNWESMADSGRPVLGGSGKPVAQRRGGLRVVRCGPGRVVCGVGTGPIPQVVVGNPPPAPQRRRGGLNENYGRELLELHTLGVDGGYTQADVINVARAFTGWTIENPRQGGGFIFRPALHDAGEKLVLGHRLPAGRGIEDGEAVLDIVARHPATARFIASKLVRHFVSDAPPPALVERAAATFRRTHGDIRAVVRTIVTSPEFFSQAAYRAKVKTPFELVVSALRAVDARPDSTPRTGQIIARLGQPIFGHRDPNGWPDVGEAWINTGSILNRINFGLALGEGRIPGVSLAGWPEGAQLLGAPRTQQVDGVIAAILGGEASPDTRRILETGANPLLDRVPETNSLRTVGDSTAPGTTAAGAAGMSDEARPPRDPREPGRELVTRMARPDPVGAPPPPNELAHLVGLALGSPEFQRR